MKWNLNIKPMLLKHLYILKANQYLTLRWTTNFNGSFFSKNENCSFACSLLLTCRFRLCVGWVLPVRTTFKVIVSSLSKRATCSLRDQKYEQWFRPLRLAPFEATLRSYFSLTKTSIKKSKATIGQIIMFFSRLRINLSYIINTSNIMHLSTTLLFIASFALIFLSTSVSAQKCVDSRLPFPFVKAKPLVKI